jgi:hypothetical protein
MNVFGPIWPIKPVEWARQSGSVPVSPFDPASDRPIRLTFHSESFEDLDCWDRAALDALIDLASTRDVEVLETGVGKFPQIRIGTESESDHFPVEVEYPDGTRLRTGIRCDDDSARIPFREASLALAHQAVRSDLFVTAHPWILRNATRFFPFRHANIMPPSAAARVVGLLLRRRGNYRGTSYVKFEGGYHFYLMRHVLRNMWRYFSACMFSGEWNEDSPAGLAQAVMTRAERALEARDAIAFEYYGGGPGAVRRIEYHFDYLMLLLNGALDAQARVAFATYDMKAPKAESKRNLRNREFLRALKVIGAEPLAQVAEENEHLLQVIARFRNTIHGASMLGVRVNKMTPEAFHFEVPSVVRSHLKSLVESAPDRDWGLTDNTQGPLILPYSFADSAVREVFRVVNEIARVTQVERLLTGEKAGKELGDGPPAGDAVFGEKMGRRFVAIGW